MIGEGAVMRAIRLALLLWTAALAIAASNADAGVLITIDKPRNA
ncbi:MAG: hypothetical protein WBW74_25065 [Xanthobacteraceae bacterium]